MLSAVTFDCVDPQRVASFWSALLGREPGPSQDGWVYLGQRGDPEPRLVFQPVPDNSYLETEPSGTSPTLLWEYWYDNCWQFDNSNGGITQWQDGETQNGGG